MTLTHPSLTSSVVVVVAHSWQRGMAFSIMYFHLWRLAVHPSFLPTPHSSTIPQPCPTESRLAAKRTVSYFFLQNTNAWIKKEEWKTERRTSTSHTMSEPLPVYGTLNGNGANAPEIRVYDVELSRVRLFEFV